jgi:hypothetical protein
VTTPTADDVLIVLRAFLKGDTGDAGEQGSMGPQGPQGEPGTTGATGPAGPSGSGGSGASIPGGRLTLVSGKPVMPQNADHSSSTLYYAPFRSDSFPVLVGGELVNRKFTSGPLDQVGASISCGTKWASGNKYDLYGIDDSGVGILGTGPAWPVGATESPGLVLYEGLPVNGASITLDLSLTTDRVVAANEATYLGSVDIGDVAGVLTATFTAGHNRRCDVWSAHNQIEIVLRGGHPPVAPETYTTWVPVNNYPAWLPYNNNLNNRVRVFTGRPANRVLDYLQRVFLNTTAPANGPRAAISTICKDVITNPCGHFGSVSSDLVNVAGGYPIHAAFEDLGASGGNWYYMAGANANVPTTGPYAGIGGVSWWGLHTTAGYPKENAQLYTAKYLG